MQQTDSKTPVIDKEIKDLFVQSTNPPKFSPEHVGVNDRSYAFRDSKWCFDTPGALQPDQVTHTNLSATRNQNDFSYY